MADGYNSILRRPPTGLCAAPSTTNPRGYTVTGAASTSALQIIPSAGGFGAPGLTQGWWDFVATGVDAYVLFGKSNVAAATTLAFIIPVGTIQPYFCTGDSAFLTVITAGGAGTLRWSPSDR